MNKFSIGEKVIALTNPYDQYSQPRVKGQTYVVKDIMYCSGCGKQTINLGCKPSGSSGKVACDCGVSTDNRGLAWTLSENFAKINEQALENAIAEENYELAAMLRDTLIQTT